MSTLRDRIGSVGTINPDLVTVGKDYQDVKEIPLARVQFYDQSLLYDDLQPLVTADGAPIAATGPGTWGQLYMAGNRRGQR